MKPVSNLLEIVLQVSLRALKIHRNLVQLWIHSRLRHDNSLLDGDLVIEGMIKKVEHTGHIWEFKFVRRRRG